MKTWLLLVRVHGIASYLMRLFKVLTI